jgi:hypothetical protein
MAKEKIEDVVSFKKETAGTVTYESDTEVDEQEVKRMAEASDSMDEDEVREMLTRGNVKKIRPVYVDKSAFDDPENPPEKFKLTLEEVE